VTDTKFPLLKSPCQKERFIICGDRILLTEKFKQYVFSDQTKTVSETNMCFSALGVLNRSR
jgi:hypothetical protein